MDEDFRHRDMDTGVNESQNGYAGGYAKSYIYASAQRVIWRHGAEMKYFPKEGLGLSL